MQGRGPAVQPALSRCPRPEDLQKLLRAVQTAPAPVHQPFSTDSGKKFVLKVQQSRGASGLGRSRNLSSAPVWSLVEGVMTIWEYSTSDVELIFNLVEEAAYSSTPGKTPPGGTSEAALAVLEELSGHSSKSALSSPSNFESRDTTRPPSGSYAAGEPPQFGQGNSPTGNNSGFNNSVSSSFSQPAQFGNASASFNNHQQYGGAGGSNQSAPDNSNRKGMQLSGNLSDLGLCELFQSISVAGLTGRLDVTSGLESLEVYFEDGAPRRASFRSDSMTGEPRDITGEEVLLEGMTWSNGFFQFNAALKSSERSPMRRLDILLMEGATLKDYLVALEKAGFNADSTPHRVSQLSEADFEKALASGIPVNMLQQKTIYMAFNGKSSFLDITRDCNLPKSVWLPLVFNLFNCGLIAADSPLPTAAPADNSGSSPMIKESIKEAFLDILRPDTGLLSYPLFMHFLEVEFQRALRLRLPFSLILLRVHKEGAGLKEQLSSEDLKLVSSKIREYLEPYDHLGHYQTLDIGILLPHRPAAQAHEYAKKIVADFNDELAQTGNQVRFIWSVGIGCVPEDGIKLGAMVSKAEQQRDSVKAEAQTQSVH